MAAQSSNCLGLTSGFHPLSDKAGRQGQLARLPERGLSRRGTQCRQRKAPALRCVLQPASRPQESLAQPPILDPSPLASPIAPDVSASTPVPGSEQWRVLPDVWDTLAADYPDSPALFDPHRSVGGGQPKLTFLELRDAIVYFAEGLKSLGLQKGQCVALLSENSHRWIIADQGVMRVGASDAVRGAKSSAKELQYVVSHSDSTGVIVETEETLQKVLPLIQDKERGQVKFVVVLWPDEEAPGGTLAERHADLGLPVLGFEEVVATGRSRRQSQNGSAPVGLGADIREDDIATMVFTSGTTGEPKAVMLTHANLMHQVRAFRKILHFVHGDVLLSLLPPWHMYERSCEYFALSRGAQQVYSSVKTFKEDLTDHPPDFFVAVPLVFDVLYNGVQRKLAAASAARAAIAKWLISASLAFMEHQRTWKGTAIPKAYGSAQDAPKTRVTGANTEGLKLQGTVEVVFAGFLALLLLPFHLLAQKLVYSKVNAAMPIRKAAISGGGSLAPHVDKFFMAMGLNLLNGYGLTETSPVLTVRRPHHNVLGTIGTPIFDTQVKVVDPDTGDTLPDGYRGIVKGKGPQVMKGYYKNPAATAAAIDAEGWFDTGDIGWITPEVPYGAGRNTGRQLVLEGRAKDTIVLANGENVEPAFVEEAALRSPAISQIMLLGQDQRRLAALIVPSKEELEALCLKRRAAKGAKGAGVEGEVTEQEKESAIQDELIRCLQAAGCGKNERIGSFALLEEPFSVDNGLLTATMKMKRDVIYKKYQDVCKSLF